MILGSTVKTLARQVPNYHLVSQGIARDSLTLCVCRVCENSKRVKKGCHLVCRRVLGKTEDDGHAIVAENGTCDRAVFKKEDNENFKLEAEESK